MENQVPDNVSFEIENTGKDYIEEETYDSEQEAEERAWYLLSCAKTGNEILHMSNPGDNPLGDDEASYEIVEL